MTFLLHHIHIRSEDPKNVSDWWATAFNLTVVGDMVGPWGERSVVCRSENGVVVSFSDFGRSNDDPRPSPSPLYYTRLDHIGFSHPDVDTAAKRLVALGAERYRAPDGSPSMPGRYHFVKVPGGITIEIN